MKTYSEIDITSMDKVHHSVSPPETLGDIVDLELDIWLGLPSRNRNCGGLIYDGSYAGISELTDIDPIDLYVWKCSCHIHWPG